MKGRGSWRTAFRFGDGAAGVLKPRHFIVGKTAFSRFHFVPLYEVFKGVEKIGRGVPDADFLFLLLFPFRPFESPRCGLVGMNSQTAAND
jgi:hypothetical protein